MKRKVLIVEDHDAFREILKTYLEMQELGLEIFEAFSGELGVVKALREKPNIVLMDLRLPGINGIEAAGRIKSYLPNCEVIILTMFETQGFKKVFRSDQVTAYIGKSELYERLIPTLKRILNRLENPSVKTKMVVTKNGLKA